MARYSSAVVGVSSMLIFITICYNAVDYEWLSQYHVPVPSILSEDSNVPIPELRFDDENYEATFQIGSFKRPVTLCDGAVKMTSAYCDSGGFCRASGIGKWRGNWSEQIRSSKLVTDSGEEIVCDDRKVKIHYVGDNHHTIWDAFILLYEIPDASRAKDITGLHAVCTDKKSLAHSDLVFPVAYRQRAFNDKIALIVSQFYSPVDLPWIEMFLRHYITIGVDVIAIYTGIDPESLYSEKLDSLLAREEFNNRVIRFEWSQVSNMQAWSHSQTSMINHGTNLFMGSTVITADLDEIVHPVMSNSIRDVVDKYNKKYGSWGFNFLSYAPARNEYERLKGKMRKVKKESWNWSRLFKRSKACKVPSWHPSGCRAKWIYRSLEPDYMRIHVIKFGAKAFPDFMPNTTYAPGTWMDPKDIVLLHIRAIQGVKGLSRRYKNGTIDKYDGSNVLAINSGLGAIKVDLYMNETKNKKGSGFELEVTEPKRRNKKKSV